MSLNSFSRPSDGRIVLILRKVVPQIGISCRYFSFHCKVVVIQVPHSFLTPVRSRIRCRINFNYAGEVFSGGFLSPNLNVWYRRVFDTNSVYMYVYSYRNLFYSDHGLSIEGIWHWSWIYCIYLEKDEWLHLCEVVRYSIWAFFECVNIISHSTVSPV